MPTIRISQQNYSYLLGVAARIQTEESRPTTPNDALTYIVEIAKQTRETLGHNGASKVRAILEKGKQ